MPQKNALFKDDFIMKLKKLKYSNCEIARRIGVSEGTIRYHIKRKQSGLPDMRKHKKSVLDSFSGIISGWIEDYKSSRRRPALKLLYKILKERHGYSNSYDSVCHYIRKHHPEFWKKRSYVRIETPPGALLQVDWKEDFSVQLGKENNWVKLQAMVFSLGFSRKTAVIFSENRNFESFIHCHQRAFRYFGGFPELVRPDCLKSAVTSWSGKEPVINERYARYMKRLGIGIFPSRPGEPTDKGKVERHIRTVFSMLDFRHTVYKDMQELQNKTNKLVREQEQTRRCGATGYSVSESFKYELPHLKSLPEYFPLFPISERYAVVRNDGTVAFANNFFQVPRQIVGQRVLCQNTGTEIIIHCNGKEIERYPYLPESKGMIMLSEKVIADKTLKISDVTRNWCLEVANRQVDIYHEMSRGNVR